MANTQQHVSVDTMNRHRQPGPPGQSLQNPYAQVGYQQQAPQQYYDGTNGVVNAAPHDQQGLNGGAPAPYTSNVLVSPLEQRRPPHLSVQVKQEPVAPTITFDYTQTQHPPQQHTPIQPSFYMNGFENPATPGIVPHDNGAQISGFHPTPVDGPMHHLAMPGQEWQQAHGKAASSGPISKSQRGGNASSPAKVPRHQFTACGACRHRRVKCDLRTRQEDAERVAILEDVQSGTTTSASTVRRRKVSCTNCQERGTNCVDEYAPLKAAKQLRRGKRISEIEMLYGKSATDAALASQGDDLDRSISPTGAKFDRLPELTREFFESSFLRRFHIQRPLIDPIELEKRYFSKPMPCAAAMGPEGAVLVHCLYAWGLSFGVDERGQLDVPDGGSEPIGMIQLHAASDSEQRRQQERQRRTEKMARAVRIILKEIDDCGMMRRPSWDGVRCLLLIVPLSEGIQSSVERQAMYQAAISQVFMLCSTESRGYDGSPAGDAINSLVSKEVEDRQEAVRARIYWYAFCHEGIQMGLRGSDLRLGADDHPMSTVNDAVSGYDNHMALISSQSLFDHSLRMASASVRLALACRMIHGALTGPKARRLEKVNGNDIRQIWEALEQSWEEFESLKHESANAPFRQTDEVVYFSDAWKVYLFEAQHVIRKQLEERLERLETKPTGAFLTDANSRSTSPVASESQTEILNLRHLLDIARHKCDDKVRNIVDSLRLHMSTSFFEWDASMVRDGTFYTAQYLAKEGGSDEDIALCIQGLNEMRWCHAKAVDRSQELRKAWFEARSRPVVPSPDPGMGTTGTSSHTRSSNHSGSPYRSPTFDRSGSAGEPPLSASTTSWPPTVSPGHPSQLRFSPSHNPDGVLPSPIHPQMPYSVFPNTQGQPQPHPPLHNQHQHQHQPHHQPQWEMPHSQPPLQGGFMPHQQQQQQPFPPDQHHLQQQQQGGPPGPPQGIIFNHHMVNHGNPAGHYVLPQEGPNMFMSYNMPPGQ